MRLGRLGTIVVGIGLAGTLIFGVWLAISKDEYQLWDLWVILALILWAISGATGQRAGALAQEGKLRESMRFHAATSVVTLLILIDMIWKPWA
jgi:drug/metabolite transporter (DMT)-like permease